MAPQGRVNLLPVSLAGILAILLLVDEGRVWAAQSPRDSSPFTIEAAARVVLQDLWRESIEAKEERVACIAGHAHRDSIFHIIRAEPVHSDRADSLRVSPGSSLGLCGPPEWAGTAHTHIATVHGQPSVTLSQNDRAVMASWRARWRVEGVFCVLYTEVMAYCEYGSVLNGDAPYAEERED